MTRERLVDTGILWAVNVLSIVIRPVADAAQGVADRLSALDWELDGVVRGFQHKYGPPPLNVDAVLTALLESDEVRRTNGMQESPQAKAEPLDVRPAVYDVIERGEP